jgi:hypothetical protein
MMLKSEQNEDCASKREFAGKDGNAGTDNGEIEKGQCDPNARGVD